MSHRFLSAATYLPSSSGSLPISLPTNRLPPLPISSRSKSSPTPSLFFSAAQIAAANHHHRPYPAPPRHQPPVFAPDLLCFLPRRPKPTSSPLDPEWIVKLVEAPSRSARPRPLAPPPPATSATRPCPAPFLPVPISRNLSSRSPHPLSLHRERVGYAMAARGSFVIAGIKFLRPRPRIRRL